jgi:membrane peptidoglycan carboxypeptidase
MFLTQEQTYIRKFKEMIISIKIEFTMSKDEILEGYLNTIYFGRGAYGIEAASQAYYGHPASELTTAEGVALAAIIQSPSNFEPEENLDALQARFDYVAAGMVSEGWLTQAEADALVMPAFIPRSANNKYGGQVGYILSTVKSELLAEGFSEAQIDGGGLTIITTVDEQAQDAVVASVEENGPTSGTEGLRIGILAVEPATGAILAMYGGTDYVTSQLNNATQARAQAGSTFKPYALSAAFEDGISLDSLWNGDSPQTISGYTLENEGNKSYGTVTLLQATENSINTPFVHVEDTVGVSKVIDAAYQAGLPEDTPGIEDNLTFVLGTASPTPLEMAATYGTFATRGVYHEPAIVNEVLLGDAVEYKAKIGGENRFDAAIMDNVNYALQSVVTNGTGSRAQALGRPNAGKTGTTDDNLSAWYIGYTPQMVAAVMMVKEDENGNPVSLSGTGGREQVFGSSFPLSMWLGFAQGYLDGKPVAEFMPPEELPDFNNPPPPSESAVPTETPTAEPTPTPTAQPTPTTTPTPTPTPSVEPSSSATPTVTPPPPGEVGAP